MNTKIYYKYCMVPQCKNTTTTAPDKLFIFLPENKAIRTKWLKLARRVEPQYIQMNSSMYFCEDHFDLPNDMENYMQYHIMGSVTKIRMKPGCAPSKFECQPDRRKWTYSSIEQPMYEQYNMMTIKECLDKSTESSTHSLVLEDTFEGRSDLQIDYEDVLDACKVAHKSIQELMTHKYRSKAFQVNRKLIDRAVSSLAPVAPLLPSPVRPRGSALPCEIKVTSGPSTVLRESQIQITLDPEFSPVIAGIKSEADSIKQEEDPQSEDKLSLAEDADQLNNVDQPSEYLITLTNAQDPLSNAPDPLSDVKVEELKVEVRPEEVNRSVELTGLPLHLSQELLRPGNDCYNLIRIQATQISKLSLRCANHRRKLHSYVQLVRRRNKKISDLQTEVEALRNFIAEHGWEARSTRRGKLDAPRIQIQSADKDAVEKKNNRQLLIVKRNNNRPMSLVSARPTSHKQTSSVGVKHTSGNIQKSLLDALHTSENRQKSSVGVKRTLNIQEKPSVKFPATSDVLQNSTVGVKRTLNIQETSSIPKTSRMGLQRISNINIQQSSDSDKRTLDHLQKSPVGCLKRTSEIVNKPSVVVQRFSEVGQNQSVAIQPISDIPQTSGGLQRTSDIRQNALVIQIDGMQNTVLQPKLVRLEDNSMDTG